MIATGSLVAASQRLHVTQSTVSTRIQRLEKAIGAELFVRHKAGTTLTPAGEQFQHHAALLTRTVKLARHEVSIVSGFRATLTVGGRLGLWEDLLLRWLPIFASLAPDVALRALIGFDEDPMQSLIDGRADLCVIYTPQSRLESEIATWERRRNASRERIQWMFDCDKARKKMRHAYPQINSPTNAVPVAA